MTLEINPTSKANTLGVTTINQKQFKNGNQHKTRRMPDVDTTLSNFAR